MPHITDDLTTNSQRRKKTWFLWDDAVIGFGLKITPANSRIFVFQYRLKKLSSVTRRYTIGRHGDMTCAQARAMAVRLARGLAKGIDPRTILPPDPSLTEKRLTKSSALSAKEDAVVKAAAAIFFEHGHRASVDLISDLAGVSRQTIYNRFGSKTNLVRHVVKSACEDMIAPLLYLDPTPPVRDVLIQYARANYAIAVGPKGLGISVLATSASTHNANIGRDVYRYGAAKVVATLETYFVLKHRNGLLEIPDAAFAAENFLAAVLGLSRSSRVHGPPPPLTERDPYLVASVDMFLRAYEPLFADEISWSSRKANKTNATRASGK